jgi:hypothetical protein
MLSTDSMEEQFLDQISAKILRKSLMKKFGVEEEFRSITKMLMKSQRKRRKDL